MDDKKGLLVHRQGLPIKSVPRGNGLVEGYLVAFGSRNDSDLERQWFTKSTEFNLNFFNTYPVLYHHGMDKTLGLDMIGRIKSIDMDDIGLWVQAQIDLANRYGKEVYNMIQTVPFGWSSGSVDHLVRVADSGEIVRWPLFEGSVTPTPAQPHKTTVRALKSILLPNDPMRQYLKELNAREDMHVETQQDTIRVKGAIPMATVSMKRAIWNTLKRHGYKADLEEIEAIASDLEVEAALSDDEYATMGDDEFATMSDDAMMFDDEAMLSDDEFATMGDDEFSTLSDDEYAMMGDDEFATMGDDEFATMSDDAMMFDDEATLSEDEFATMSRKYAQAKRARMQAKRAPKRAPQKAVGSTRGYVDYLEQRIKSLELQEAPNQRSVGMKATGIRVTRDSADQPGAYKSVLNKMLRYGERRLSHDENRILNSRPQVSFGGADSVKSADGSHAVIKALTTSNPSSAGYGVPDDFIADLNKNATAASQMAPLAGKRKTTSDTIIQPDLPTTDGRRGFPGQANYPGEVPANQAASQITDMALGQIQIPMHVLLISTLVSYSALEDVAFDLQAYITEQFGEIIGVEQDTKIWSGNGQGKMRGIVTDTRVVTNASTGTSSVSGYLASGDATTIKKLDPIRSMKMHINPMYRKRAMWFMNSNTADVLSQLKNAQGDYLWGADARGANGDINDKLFNLPWVANEFADDVAANGYPLILADLQKAYLIGERVEFSIRRFDDAAYAVNDQALFIGRARFGGQVIQPNAIKVLKIAVS